MSDKDWMYIVLITYGVVLVTVTIIQERRYWRQLKDGESHQSDDNYMEHTKDV